MLNNILADSVTRIRNGYKANLRQIELCYSNLIVNLLNILKEEGYINDYEVYSEGNKKTIGVVLKYVKNRKALKTIKCISKPGQRMYAKHDKIPVVANGLGCLILSTNRGVMTSHHAKVLRLGGELLVTVF